MCWRTWLFPRLVSKLVFFAARTTGMVNSKFAQQNTGPCFASQMATVLRLVYGSWLCCFVIAFITLSWNGPRAFLVLDSLECPLVVSYNRHKGQPALHTPNKWSMVQSFQAVEHNLDTALLHLLPQLRLQLKLSELSFLPV